MSQGRDQQKRGGNSSFLLMSLLFLNETIMLCLTLQCQNNLSLLRFNFVAIPNLHAKCFSVKGMISYQAIRRLRSKYTNTNDTATGVTPEMRAACPTVWGA